MAVADALTEADMQLIGMLDSPYVRRVAIAMLTARLKFDHRPISLFRYIDEFVAVSPLLKAPSLVIDDNVVLVESGVILNYLATFSPVIAAMRAGGLSAFRAEGVALTVCEKAVQMHYERALRKPEERSESWSQRIRRQLDLGLAALDREVTLSGWLDGDAIGLADITVAVAFGFTQGIVGDLVDTAGYSRLAAFCARAEALPAFTAAPAIDGAKALG